MVDYTPRQGESVPLGTRTRYVDMGDGTHALLIFDGSAGAGIVQQVDVIDRAPRDLGVVRVSVIGTGGNVIGSVRVVGELPAGLQTIGAVRLLATYDGATYVPPRLDASTFAFETVDYAHHEVHSGSAYECHYCQMVSDVNDRSIITFRTPNTTRYLHMFARGGSTALAAWHFWRAPNVVDNTGAPLDVFNRNHNSPNTSGTWDTSQNPDVQGQATFFTELTMGNVAGGTDLDMQYIGAGSGPRAVGGGSRGEEERLLLPNTLYAFEIQSLTNDDNYHCVHLTWYEHVDRAA